MKPLKEIWEELRKIGHETDKGSVHSYLEIYADLFKDKRDTANNVLEIGLFNGASLRMWEKYFTKAVVYGVDCHETPCGGLGDLRPMIAERSHNIILMDATSEGDTSRHFAGMKFDVIIDDASHYMPYQLETYHILKNYMAEGGIYIIEDIQDLEPHRAAFEALAVNGKTVEIIDRRKIKDRYDDVLVVIK